MELHKWHKDTEKKSKIKNNLNFMLDITPKEAYEIIKSLSSQLVGESPNVGRAEFQTSDGEYFSIAVKNDSK